MLNNTHKIMHTTTFVHNILVCLCLEKSSLNRKFPTLIKLSLGKPLNSLNILKPFTHDHNFIYTSVWKSISISHPLRIRWLTIGLLQAVQYKHTSFISEWEVPSYWQSLSCLPGECSADSEPNQCFLPWQPSAAPSCCFWFPGIAELEAMGKAQWNHKAKLYVSEEQAQTVKTKERVCGRGGQPRWHHSTMKHGHFPLGRALSLRVKVWCIELEMIADPAVPGWEATPRPEGASSRRRASRQLWPGG